MRNGNTLALEKQEYLADRMIDGARALSSVFNWLKTSRTPLTSEVVENLVLDCELTQNQAVYLHKTFERAQRAQGVIRYLEDRFGVDGNLDFQDSEGLHKLLFKGKNCPKKIQAKSHNIGIGFTRQNWRYEDSIGRAGLGFFYNQLNSPLDQTIKRLENGKMTNVADLCFTLPSKKHLIKIVEKNRSEFSDERKILLVIYGPSMEQEAEKHYDRIQEHELRHVIDFILHSNPGYSETQADLISENSFRGLNRDLRDTKTRIEKSINFFSERMENHKETDLLFEKAKESYNRGIKRKENFDQSLVLIKELVKKIPKQDYEVLSYVFSTLPGVWTNNSLNHLKLLNTYYENKLKQTGDKK